jgi:membrane protease subunit HflC
MKRNALTVIVGVLIVIIFFLLLFTFQVRLTEVAVVTTFDKPARYIENPGLYFKWPYPVQKVYPFDKRIHNFEDRYEETTTRDGHNMLASVYIGWSIRDPRTFFNNFPVGTPQAAQPALESVVRSAKQAVIGQHSFSDFVSTDPKQLKFSQMEDEIAKSIRENAANKYGINIEFLGIKRIGLPESVTGKVFDRMTAERQREVDRLKALGESESISIRSAADTKRDEILAKARAEATAIRGQAEAEATKAYQAFNENPDLAIFLMKLKALELSLKDRATLLVDPGTSPFELLRSTPENTGAKNGNGSTQAAPAPNTLSQNADGTSK